eukprot:gb/GECH01009169.1/.p1 GENE.gb/GECH01009169.1/~~gb/GECH01009169.1/.p1  ORF type:complete len:265 (+),score=10.63 gb/GECH01009169.1/:1-795(+)
MDGIGIHNGEKSPLLIHYVVVGIEAPSQRFEVELSDYNSEKRKSLIGPGFLVEVVDMKKNIIFASKETAINEDDTNMNRYAFYVSMEKLESNLFTPTMFVITPIINGETLKIYSLCTPYFRTVSINRFFRFSTQIHDALYPRVLRMVRTLKQQIVVQGYFFGIPSLTKMTCNFYENLNGSYALIDQKTLILDNWHQFIVDFTVLYSYTSEMNIFVEFESSTKIPSKGETYHRRLWSPEGFRVKIPNIHKNTKEFLFWTDTLESS